jgi:hypothetical protein
MKIDPTLLTQKLTEANVHPGFYKMLGLKGPSYKWVKCPINEVKVGDTIKIVEYDEIPKNEYGNPKIPEGWGDHMQEQCGKEFKVANREEARAAMISMAYVCPSSLSPDNLYIRVVRNPTDFFYCWHRGCYDCRKDYKNNLFYVRRACES